MVIAGGAMTRHGYVGDGSLEAYIMRDKDYPPGWSLSKLGLSVKKDLQMSLLCTFASH